MRFFENLGIPLKTERGRRVFPASDRADDIADALAGFARENGAQAVREPVQSVLAEAWKGTGGCAPSRGEYRAGSVLLACGGASYPGTGSNGDGYRLARALGHRSALLCRPWCLWWSRAATAANDGLSPAQLRRKGDEAGQGKSRYMRILESCCSTHFGLSGPTILSASAHMHPMEAGLCTIHLDLKPALSEIQLDARLLGILRRIKQNLCQFSG